jgi:hypothetical protein
MRPNYAQDAPPTAINVGGFSYTCNTDFRTWIDVLKLLQGLNLHPQTETAAQKTLETIREIQIKVFGRVLDAPLNTILRAIVDFSKGYPTAPMRGSGDGDGVRVYSFEYDLNEIIIAIRNQSGIDLSYRCKHFHWWEFLLEFRTLSGNHYILNLMEARGYTGKDKDLRKRRDACALPDEYTAEELEALEAFNALFDGVE